jgi:Cu-processing system ATP-binding protein
VDHLDFEVHDGETFALIGPNGAGKTTTLKLLLGLARPDEGTVQIGPDGLSPHDARARQSLGYVPQRVEFPPARTVAQVMSFFADLRGLEPASVDRALERVGLTAHRDRLASDLSGGYTQRLSLAQALLSDPALLVLDEPTASLDPEATWEFRTLVEQLRRERKTVVLSSHLLSEVERVADRVLILNEGRRAALESLSELRERQLQASRLRIELQESAVPRGAGSQALRARVPAPRRTGDPRARDERQKPRAAGVAPRRGDRASIVPAPGPNPRGDVPRRVAGGRQRGTRCELIELQRWSRSR